MLVPELSLRTVLSDASSAYRLDSISPGFSRRVRIQNQTLTKSTRKLGNGPPWLAFLISTSVSRDIRQIRGELNGGSHFINDVSKAYINIDVIRCEIRINGLHSRILQAFIEKFLNSIKLITDSARQNNYHNERIAQSILNIYL